MAQPTPDATRTTGPGSPMVGRTAERVLIQEQFEATEAGRGQLVIIGGEAGIGKSTIARDLIASAQARGCLVMIGHNYDLMASSPYGVWLDLADRYRTESGEHKAPPLPRVFSNQLLSSFTDQVELIAEVRAWFQNLASTSPVLVVLEDLQWADPASLRLLRHIASHLEHMRLLLVVTYRVDDLTRQNPFYLQLPTLIRESEGLRIDLKRLRREDLREMVANRYTFGEADLNRLVGYLTEHSEGNPFFALELLRALEEREDNGLRRSSDGWKLGELDRVVVPPLVSNVIDSRLARLGEFAQEPLAIAAIIGQEVPYDLWSEVAGLDSAGLLEVIDLAVDSSLLSPGANDNGMQFVHALTREALYQRVNPVRRKRIHLTIAEVLLSRTHSNSDPIAYHLAQAGDPRAPEWLITAGERAQRAFAWLTASDRFLTAAGILADVPGQELTRARLLYRYARLQRYADPEGAVEKLRAASRLAQEAGDAVLAADAIYSCGLVYGFADNWQRCVEEMESGVASLEALPAAEVNVNWTTANWMADVLPPVEQLDAPDVDPALDLLAAAGMNNRRGTLPWFFGASGHLRYSKEVAETFLSVLDGVPAGPMVLASKGHAAHGLGMALAAYGQISEAAEAFATAREIYGGLDHYAAIAFACLHELNDLVVPWLTTDVAARHHLAAAAEHALERGEGAFPADIPQQCAHLVPMYLDGRWSEARTIGSERARFGSYVLRRQVTLALLPISWHQGRIDEMWTHISGLLPTGTRSEPGSTVLHDALNAQQFAIEHFLATGDLAQARDWHDAQGHWLEWSGSRFGQAEHALAESRIWATTGDHEAVWESANRAVELASSPRQPLVLMAALRNLGTCLLQRGELEMAESAAAETLALADQCAAPFERAQSLLLLARIQATQDRETATANARGARSIFFDLDAGPSLARVESLLADLGAPGDQFPSLDGLSRREFDVLRLVALGLTDAEIGERLYISPRTASQHLRSIYGKLGVHSRAAATRYAIQHQLG